MIYRTWAPFLFFFAGALAHEGSHALLERAPVVALAWWGISAAIYFWAYVRLDRLVSDTNSAK